MLRRNGPDCPVPSGAYKLSRILDEIQDSNRIDALLKEHRKNWPALDRWFTERFISNFTKEDLKQYPPDSVAGIYYKYIVERNFQIDIVPRYEPKNDYEFWRLRSGQTHDFEHIIGGGGRFDSYEEMVPYYMKLASIFKFFPAELAGELSVFSMFGSMRFVSRTMLHYPECWVAMYEQIDRGRRIGLNSDAYYLTKYEDVFHLDPAEARKKIGIREVQEGDSRDFSAVWDCVKVAAMTRAGHWRGCSRLSRPTIFPSFPRRRESSVEPRLRRTNSISALPRVRTGFPPSRE